MRWPAGLILVLLLAWPGVGSAPARESWFLQITKTSDERLLWEAPVRAGDFFTIDYTHSSDHTPVHDVFQVSDGGEIILVEEDYQWYGAGLDPHPIDGTIDFSGRWTRVRLHRAFPNFILRVGTVANHVLTVEGKAAPLLDIAKGRERVWIHVTRKKTDAK